MAAKAKAAAMTEVDILKINTASVEFHLLGTTPLILRRMSVKAMQELLMPKGKKTAADKASNLKHDPYQEFLDSPYTDADPKAPTLIQQLSTCFKGALKGAALDLPGANKSQIGRLTWVKGERIGIYGTPQIFCSVVRSADMNRTPDVRTRLIIKDWACKITICFVTPLLRDQAIANLLASAGLTNGVGDWRPQKGSGTYGQFELVSKTDPRYTHIIQHGGRKVQEQAMQKPEAYDDETRDLLHWFEVESKRRGFNVVAA